MYVYNQAHVLHLTADIIRLYDGSTSLNFVQYRYPIPEIDFFPKDTFKKVPLKKFYVFGLMILSVCIEVKSRVYSSLCNDICSNILIFFMHYSTMFFLSMSFFIQKEKYERYRTYSVEPTDHRRSS